MTTCGRLFSGIHEFAGRIRDCKISKAERMLNGEQSFMQASTESEQRRTMISDRKRHSGTKRRQKKETAEHLAKFTSSLWRIHAFGEGNTITAAVSVIKYLRSLGFDMASDPFADNSRYLRDALVRANHSDHGKHIYPAHGYLDKFFGNLMLGENNVPRNREMLVEPNENKASRSDRNGNGDIGYLQRHPNATQVEIADAAGILRVPSKERSFI